VASSGTQAARLLVGTAGHIDHGKTALVKALTGIDTDRLPEEKSRGITIELGFAHFETAAGQTVGVVDVPGHERFVRAMVAGATGIDVALLVVAADEGVMPQTREHLDICGLLGIPRGLVALTKADLVEPEWLEMAAADVRAALRGTFLADAAIVPCSAVTGAGIAALREQLERLTAEAGARPADGPLRLPLDRVFSVKGFGTVVTGTLATGRLREGEDVVVLPGGAAAKVRGIEVHGVPRPEAQAGERTAANLHGAERAAVTRGEVLVRPGEALPSSIIDVELALLPVAPAPVATRAKALFHALTTQENATIVLLEAGSLAPGGRALAQLHLQRPVPLLPGDRFILRGFRPLPGYGTTIGGGRVLRVLAPKRRRADAPAAALLRRMAAAASPEERVALEVEAAGRAGIDRAGLRARTGEGTKRIDRALELMLGRRAALTFHRDTGAVVAAAVVRELSATVLEVLARFHAAQPLRAGLAREELRTSQAATRALDPRLFALVLAELARAGQIEAEQDLVRSKGFSPRPAEAERDVAVERTLEVYRTSGLAPPWNNELPAKLGVPAGETAAALEILIRRGDLVRIKPDLCFHRAALDQLRERLRGFLIRAGQITPQEWKELTGQTRKYAIPLAEHFDADKLTLRIGDLRKLRG
jgi:selenocysteine-specific elongation factor